MKGNWKQNSSYNKRELLSEGDKFKMCSQYLPNYVTAPDSVLTAAKESVQAYLAFPYMINPLYTWFQVPS